MLLSDEEVQLAWRLQAAGIPARYDSRIVVRHQIQATRLTPGWLLSRLYWQGVSTVLTRRLLGDAGAVWRELPRRLAVAALLAPFALLPEDSDVLLACRWRLAYAAGFVRAALGLRRRSGRVAAVQLFAWEGVARNFGDSLNRLLWPRLLPDFFDDDPAKLFLGIGSVLDARHDASTVKLVAGAGYGGYAPLPTLDTRWIIHWVRGPRTARLLGLPDDCALGDPAMLLSIRRRDADPSRIGFMPHFESAANGAWAEVAQAVGVTLIDPRDEPAGILAAIGGCRHLLSEAMHGAIVADAMRTPWVALRPLAAVHRPKWHDWADALGLQLRFHCLPASTLPEWLWATQLAACHRGRGLLRCAGPWLTGAARRRFVDRASRALAAAAAAPAQLSADAALDRCRAHMTGADERYPAQPAHTVALHLHRTSAYHHRR